MDDRAILAALRQACATLAGVSVPVSETWQVAAPILDAMATVKACAEALEARLNAPEPEEMAIREDEI